MSDRPSHPPVPSSRCAAGFSMVEATVAVLIVGLLFAAAMSTVGASRSGQLWVQSRARAHLLAQDLMNEIISQPYSDPDGGGLLGLEADETLSSDRLAFDDIDDYAQWSASPPERRDGTPVAGFDGWQRRVNVQWVDPASGSLNENAGAETGAKRITVTVSRGEHVLAELTALRTRDGIGPARLSGELLP